MVSWYFTRLNRAVRARKPRFEEPLTETFWAYSTQGRVCMGPKHSCKDEKNVDEKTRRQEQRTGNNFHPSELNVSTAF